MKTPKRNPGCNPGGVLFSDTQEYRAEKLRLFTAWTDSAEIRAINNLDNTKLKRVPIYLWRAGLSECTDQFKRERFADSKTRMFTIELVTAGNAIVEQNGREYQIGPGEIYLLHNYAELRWKTGDAGFVHKRFVLIDGPALEPILHSLNLASQVRIKPDSPQAIARLFKRANLLLSGQEPGAQDALIKLAFDILLEISAPVRSSEYPQPVMAALELMHNRIQTSLTLTELARSANVSSGYLSFLFKKHVGMAPLNLYLTLKIERAKMLMNDPSLTIKEIAAQCGYDDPYFFSKQFKKFTGKSPRAFRQARPDAV